MSWLIDDVRRAWRYLTVQLSALLVILAAMWEYLPQFQQYLDPKWVKYYALAILVARVINQTPKQPATPADPQ